MSSWSRLYFYDDDSNLENFYFKRDSDSFYCKLNVCFGDDTGAVHQT